MSASGFPLYMEMGRIESKHSKEYNEKSVMVTMKLTYSCTGTNLVDYLFTKEGGRGTMSSMDEEDVRGDHRSSTALFCLVFAKPCWPLEWSVQTYSISTGHRSYYKSLSRSVPSLWLERHFLSGLVWGRSGLIWRRVGRFTFQVHPSLKTFPEAAGRTVLPANLIDDAIVPPCTQVVVLACGEKKGRFSI